MDTRPKKILEIQHELLKVNMVLIIENLLTMALIRGHGQFLPTKEEIKYLYYMKNIMRIILVCFVLSFLVGCNNSLNERGNVISHFEKSEISQYIDFDSEVQVLDSDCLLKFKESLSGIIWDEKTTLNLGISFVPKVSSNPFSHYKGEKKWLCFYISTISEMDTTYSYEAYYFNNYFNSLNPCYFDEQNITRVDSVIEIIPNLLILEENCILNITKTDLTPGVFEKVDYIQ